MQNRRGEIFFQENWTYCFCYPNGTAMKVATYFSPTYSSSSVFLITIFPTGIWIIVIGKSFSRFWTSRVCGMKFYMSISRPPQTDGASKIMDRILRTISRCYCSSAPVAEFFQRSYLTKGLKLSPTSLR